MASRAGSLSLAGSGGGTVGLGTSGGSIGLGAHGSSHVDGVGQRSLAHAAKGLASSGTLAALLVGGEVEGDEENQV